MANINSNLVSLNNKKPTINWTTLSTTLGGTIIIGAFMFYIGMVKFTAEITHQVNNNAADILELKEDQKECATKSMINAHAEQENYNFKQVGKKIDVEFIFHKPIK